jgi:hypothetical protein
VGTARQRIAPVRAFLFVCGAGFLSAQCFPESSRHLLPADALFHVWPGVRDSSERSVENAAHAPPALSNEDEQRVRTVVAPVSLPWLGPRVLYLEEFLHDDPATLRRELLLKIEPDPANTRRVRVYPYVFRDPERWRQLNRSPRMQQALQAGDIQATHGCDLVLSQEGDQFRGGTTGFKCRDDWHGTPVYVDYRIVISSDLYWYRRRLLRESDDELQEEVIGYNWFEPGEARLFVCRVAWSASGRLSDLRPLARLDIHDQGGHAHFSTPDGREFDLALHSEDWPFSRDRDALILLLQDSSASEPIASAWTELDAQQISIDLGWMSVRCGPLVPETDELAS